MKSSKGCLIVGTGLLALLIAAVVLTGVSGYNRLVKLSQAVDAQWAQVQNVYQRRADLVPNLVKTVEGAANFEKSTLAEVINARASVGKVAVGSNTAPANPEEFHRFEDAQGALSSALSRLLVVVERYPDLKANANFQGLQAQLEGTENRISVERGRFNQAVQEYNSTLRSFPLVLVAPMFGFQPKPYFAAAAGAETPPQVEFNFGAKSPAPAGR